MPEGSYGGGVEGGIGVSSIAGAHRRAPWEEDEAEPAEGGALRGKSGPRTHRCRAWSTVRLRAGCAWSRCVLAPAGHVQLSRVTAGLLAVGDDRHALRSPARK